MTTTARKPTPKATPKKGTAGRVVVKNAAGSGKTLVAKKKGLESVFGILTDAEADQAAARVSKLRGYNILSK